MTLKFRHLIVVLLAPLALATPTPSPAPVAEADALSATQPAPDAEFAQDMILQALGLIGVKYRWGGSTPESGLDCSGFIRYVFQQSLNIALPHNAFAISRLGEDIDKSALQPGDLVFFNTLGRQFSHVGIYLGDDRFIHSPRKGQKIQIVRLSDAYWVKRYNGARRVTNETVTARSPFLQQLMEEARASQRSAKKKAIKPGKTKKKKAISTARKKRR
ncbi:C40 family peptidase [Chitinimonas sp. BJYL2]|uniref:C40 family peptidase n=1 Tax=Chitinimonas sp. BJYL2 TaxID=2976696 RepID=UPI0022B38AB2|nr:C40 family peptidase [Chitinimonas sp. BJYL2]